MKTLKQLALVTAVAAMSTGSFALEQLDDKELATKTGQDGLTVKITPASAGINIEKLLIHDNDGFSGTVTEYVSNPAGNAVFTGQGTAGALAVNNMNIKGGVIELDIDTDGGAAAGNDAYLNVAATLNGPTTIKMDSITVHESGAVNAAGYSGAAKRGVADTGNKILGALDVTINGAMSLNAQLGSQPQGAMAYIASNVTNGISIADLEVIDADGGSTASQAGLHIKDLKLTNNANADLSLAASVNIDTVNGIEITTGATPYYAYMTDVGFSDGNQGAVTAGTIGDVEIIGLELGSTIISIAGK